MNLTRKIKYYDYLTHRSKKAMLYRKFFLYPILTKYLRGKVLDFGCGIGDFLSFRKNTVGVDINEFVVNYNIRRGREVILIKPNKEIPFKDESFDSILLDNVLEHIENPVFLIKELHRILKTNGILLVGVPGKIGFYLDKDHKIYYDQRKLINFFEQNYFITAKLFHVPFKSNLLNERLKIYCIYGVFKKKIEKNIYSKYSHQTINNNGFQKNNNKYIFIYLPIQVIKLEYLLFFN